jgi:hypothetical protein
MVYRDLSTDSAAQMFDELVRPKIPETVEQPSEVPVTVVPKQKKKKVVKAVLPKS